MPESITTAAPSAAPGTVPPAQVPAPTPAAPSAPAPTPPPLQTQADFDRYAAAAIAANLAPPPEPAAPPPASPGPESPPAEPAAPAAQTSTPGSTPDPGVPARDPRAGTEDEDAEPSAEVLASLTEPGLRALQSEREKRKAARAEVQELKAQLARLQINSPAEPPVPPPPAAGAMPAATAPPAVPGSLAACRTFDQVDASAMAALQQKSLATELILTLAAGERDAVLERLKAEKVEHIAGTPLAETSDAQLRKLLVNVQAGCELTLQQAPQRKQELMRESRSFGEAVKILPALGDAQSEAFKAFKLFVDQNPAIRQLGPNWPELVAEGVAHRLTRVKTNGQPAASPASPAAVPAPATNPAVPPATPRSAPGAPRTSAGALPARKSERDEIVERLHNGSATQKDMDRYATLSLSAA